jgi:hypothetical protein
MKKIIKVFVTGVSITLSASMCYKKSTDTTPHPTIADSLSITSDKLYPEGVDYNFKNNTFIIGSLYNGNIYEVGLTGALKTVITDNNLVGAVGVYTDEIRNRLVVVSGDAGISQKSAPNGVSAGSEAYVGIYNLTTYQLIKSVNLKSLTPNAGAFPNDIAVDEEGNMYITDSFSPVVYKIDGSSYTASIFLTDTVFKPAPNAFGLNGIVYNNSGFLIVAKTDNGKLYKIPVKNPTKFSLIDIPAIVGADGLEFTKNNELAVVENGLGAGKVQILQSVDNFTTATKKGEKTIGKSEFPTTAALAGNGKLYVLHAKLGTLLNGTKTDGQFSLTAY